MSFSSNKIGERVDRGKTATTRNLTKILIYLKEMKTQGCTKEISIATGVEGSRCKDALRWLLSHGLISKDKNSQYPIYGKYYLNDEQWKRAR